MKKWLFNPFIYIAGAKSLVIGWVFMLLIAFCGHYNNVHFDGVLDLHSGKDTPVWFYFAEQLVDWASVVFLFYIAGRIFSRSLIRLIDVAGTLALARWVLIFAYLFDLGLIGPFIPKNGSLIDLINAIGYTFVLGAFLILGIFIWYVTLMYNAFTISCNLKGSKATGIFITSLVLAELLSKIIIYLLFKNMI